MTFFRVSQSKTSKEMFGKAVLHRIEPESCRLSNESGKYYLEYECHDGKKWHDKDGGLIAESSAGFTVIPITHKEFTQMKGEKIPSFGAK